MISSTGLPNANSYTHVVKRTGTNSGPPNDQSDTTQNQQTGFLGKLTAGVKAVFKADAELTDRFITRPAKEGGKRVRGMGQGAQQEIQSMKQYIEEGRGIYGLFKKKKKD